MSSYERDVAAARQAGRAWPCRCGAENPPDYDTCHDCQRPSWTCADCYTVSSSADYPCRRCGGTRAAETLTAY